MTRLFVALRPPPEVVARLAALDRPALPGVRWSAPEQWLVKLRRSVALLADRSSPKTIRFEELASFPLEERGPA